MDSDSCCPSWRITLKTNKKYLNRLNIKAFLLKEFFIINGNIFSISNHFKIILNQISDRMKQFHS